MCVHCPLYGREPIDSQDSNETTDSTTCTVPALEVPAVSPKDSVVDEKDQKTANLEALLKEKEAEIGNLSDTISQRDVHIANLEAALNHIYNPHG